MFGIVCKILFLDLFYENKYSSTKNIASKIFDNTPKNILYDVDGLPYVIYIFNALKINIYTLLRYKH